MVQNRSYPTLRNLIDNIYVPGEQRIIGLTGQAGAGKTWLSHTIAAITEENGIPLTKVALDWFFIKSSLKRKNWLAEAKDDPEEHDRRANQINWWDFERTAKVLDDLRKGQKVELSQVYDRANNGELTKNVSLDPNPEGGLIMIEGVAICDLPIDSLVFVFSTTMTRLKRLAERDKARRQGEEIFDRFKLTEAFEQGYFTDERLGNIHAVVENAVVGNGNVKFMEDIRREILISPE